MLNHKDIFTVNEAPKALAIWGEEKSIRKLANCVDHPSGFKIHDAAEAIGDFDHPEAVKCLLEFLVDRHFQRHAAESLKRMGEQAEGPTLALLDSKNENTVRIACEILKQVGGRKSVAKLKDLASRSGRFQRVAKDALDECASRE